MKNFIDGCKRSECDYEFAVENINPRIAHCLFGLETEIGELIDPFKKFWFYGGLKSIDLVNVKEEIGDVLYYLAILMDEIITEMNMNCKSDLPIVPFIIDHDGSMELKMYNIDEGVSVNKFDTSIGDVPIIVYSKSSIFENEQEEE